MSSVLKLSGKVCTSGYFLFFVTTGVLNLCRSLVSTKHKLDSVWKPELVHCIIANLTVGAVVD